MHAEIAVTYSVNAYKSQLNVMESDMRTLHRSHSYIITACSRDYNDLIVACNSILFR